MNNPQQWRERDLYDLNGKLVGTARVPVDPLPPVVIHHGIKFYLLTAPKGDYQEIKCYLVPLEHMYAARPAAKPATDGRAQ